MFFLLALFVVSSLAENDKKEGSLKMGVDLPAANRPKIEGSGLVLNYKKSEGSTSTSSLLDKKKRYE